VPIFRGGALHVESKRPFSTGPSEIDGKCVQVSEPSEAQDHTSGANALPRLAYFGARQRSGFDQDHADHVFEPLKRLGMNNEQGSGIGLAICKKIIHRLGGQIWAKSQVGQEVHFLLRFRGDRFSPFTSLLTCAEDSKTSGRT
jgi:hypothetical protein